MSSPSDFSHRHIGPDAADVATMLAVIGVDSLEELAAKALPAGILDTLGAHGTAPGLDELPPAATEHEALAELHALADTNTVAVSMIGQGYYDTLTPPVLLRPSRHRRTRRPRTRWRLSERAAGSSYRTARASR